MIRPAILCLVAWFLHALHGGLALLIGSAGVPMLPGVVLVAYVALVVPPVEAAASAALIGFVLDATTGSPVGLNMLACLAVALLGRFAAVGVPSPLSRRAVLFTFALSAAYVMFLATLMAAFGGPGRRLGVLEMSAVLTTACLNALIALPVFAVVHAVFVRLGFEEAEQSFAERLSRRASAARRRSS